MGKGKQIFSIEEYSEICELVRQLENADAIRQKGIRNKLRAIGLYWSEVGENMPYTLTNLQSLFKNGILKVDGIGDPSLIENNKVIKDIHPSASKEKQNNRIFISYKRRNKDLVFPLKDLLEKEIGEKCWIDLDGIESDAQFVAVIMKAINDCEVFLFMYSGLHNSITDYEEDWTIRELQFAKSKGKKIVFLNLDRSELGDWFSFMFGQKQQVDVQDKRALYRLISDLKNWLSIEPLPDKNSIPTLDANSDKESRNSEVNTDTITSEKDNENNIVEEDKDKPTSGRSKALKPKEIKSDKECFEILYDIFSPEDYVYDYIVSGVTIKKKLEDSKKRGIISFSECKRNEDGTVFGNLYFLPMSKNLDLLTEKKIEYVLAWNGVPFVRNVTIHEGKKIINNLFDDIDKIISDKSGEKKVSVSKDSEKDNKSLADIEIKDIKFSINENNLVILITIFSTRQLGPSSVRILLGDRYFLKHDNINKNKTKKIKFSITGKQLKVNSGEVNDCNFNIQVLEKGKVVCEKKEEIKLYYEKHLFTKNILEIRK